MGGDNWTILTRAGIENVAAIKVAPFDRHDTLDVLNSIALAGAEKRITLYTDNNDHIVTDPFTPFAEGVNGREVTLRFKGGLLGHWAVWIRTAVYLLGRVHAAPPGDPALFSLDTRVTCCNAAFFRLQARDAGVPLALEPLHPMTCAVRSVLTTTAAQSLDWCETLADGGDVEVDVHPIWGDPDILAQVARPHPHPRLPCLRLAKGETHDSSLIVVEFK